MTLSRDQFRAVVDDQSAVEVLLVVDAVLDLVAVPIDLPLLGTVALHIASMWTLMTLYGARKPSLDALLERIGVNGRAEVVMFETYFVSFGVAVMPIWVAVEK